MTHALTAAAGFGTGLSFIGAIGAQNAFVLRQGLRRDAVLAVVGICAASDALLIALGVGGVGAVVAATMLTTGATLIAGTGTAVHPPDGAPVQVGDSEP